MIVIRKLALSVLPLLLAASVVPACAAPPAAIQEEAEEEEGTDATAPGNTKKTTTPKDTPPTTPKPGDGAACPYTGPPIDVSGFAPCLDGGRCVPAAVVPENERVRLAACTGGFCVAEKIIKAQGVHLPKTCTSLAGGEGRCTSTVFPDVEKQKASLPVDVCDPNERCAPCFNPTDGKETGACRTVSCDAPKTKPVTFAECCKATGVARGRCVPKATLPPEALSGLEKKECDAASLCAPAENFDEKYVPPKCTASSLLGKYDGVCISTCVKQDFFTQLGTAQGNCATGSFCAPCKNPLTGGPSGAPGCAP